MSGCPFAAMAAAMPAPTPQSAQTSRQQLLREGSQERMYQASMQGHRDSIVSDSRASSFSAASFLELLEESGLMNVEEDPALMPTIEGSQCTDSVRERLFNSGLGSVKGESESPTAAAQMRDIPEASAGSGSTSAPTSLRANSQFGSADRRRNVEPAPGLQPVEPDAPRSFPRARRNSREGMEDLFARCPMSGRAVSLQANSAQTKAVASPRARRGSITLAGPSSTPTNRRGSLTMGSGRRRSIEVGAGGRRGSMEGGDMRMMLANLQNRPRSREGSIEGGLQPTQLELLEMAAMRRTPENAYRDTSPRNARSREGSRESREPSREPSRAPSRAPSREATPEAEQEELAEELFGGGDFSVDAILKSVADHGDGGRPSLFNVDSKPSRLASDGHSVSRTVSGGADSGPASHKVKRVGSLGGSSGDNYLDAVSNTSGGPFSRVRASKAAERFINVRPPKWAKEDVEEYAPIVKDSWSRLINKEGVIPLAEKLIEGFKSLSDEFGKLFANIDRGFRAKFVDMLSQMVREADDPKKVHFKLVALGAVHSAANVKPYHMKGMGDIVKMCLQDFLLEEWGEAGKAWDWFWNYMSASMEDVLEAFERRKSPILQTWDSCLDAFTKPELGDMFYESLFEYAPNIKILFHKPKQVMGVKIVEMVDKLVDLQQHSDLKQTQELAWLGLRHVKYGAEPHHVPLMGQALVRVIRLASGEAWREEYGEMWLNMWDKACDCMMKAMKEGKQYGEAVQGLWERLQKRSTPEDFGVSIVQSLMTSCPEFLDAMSRTIAFSQASDESSDGTASTPETASVVSVDDTQLKSRVGRLLRAGKMAAKMVRSKAANSPLPKHVNFEPPKPPRPTEHRKSVMEEPRKSMDGHRKSVDGPSSPPGPLTRENSNQFVSVESGKSSTGKGSGPPNLMSMESRSFKGNLSKMQEVGSFVLSKQVSRDSWRAPPKVLGGGGDHAVTSGEFGKEKKEGALRSFFGGHTKHNFHFSVRKKHNAQLAAMIQDEDYEDVNHKLVAQQAALLGPEMWEMVSNVCEMIWKPDDMYQYLIVASTRLQNQGLKYEHLGELGSAVHFAMQTALKTGCGGCGIGDWFKDDSDGWYWLWTLCTQMMEKTLKGKEMGFAQNVRESWELIKSRCEPAEIGDAMYCELRTEAPHLMKLFHRPRRSQAFMFMQALELIVTFGEDPGRFMESLRTLTLRHIKYGVKTEHIYPFGRAIISGIEKLLGRDWNKEYEKAWNDVWDRAMKTTAHLFNVDSNVVIVAVVKGEVETLRELVAFAPRGERIHWMTEVELNGHKISPIYWSIGDGKLDIAQFMIRDALAIRADSERYYYGREDLFNRHKNLFEVLCDRCPALIEDVLDGLLWHSQIVTDGVVRCNYYIKELYGDPDEFRDPWKTPLAVLCTKGNPEFFYHPAMKKCLELKWNGLQKYFVGLQLLYASFLVLFIVGFLEMNKEEPLCTNTAIGLRLTTGAFGATTVIIMTCLIFQQIRNGQVVKQKLTPKLTAYLPRLLGNQWNAMRFFSMIALCVATIFEPCWFPHLHKGFGGEEEVVDELAEGLAEAGRRVKKTQGSNDDWGDPSLVTHTVDWYMILLGITGLAMCTQLIQLLIISTQLAGLTYMVGKLLSDVTRNMVIMVIVIMGFALFLTALKEPWFEHYGDSAMILTKFMVGLEVPPFLEMSGPGMAVLILFIIISDIGLLSILVAQLAIAYEMLSLQNIGYAQMNRAFVCVEVESVLPLRMRRAFYTELQFDKPLDFESGDEGPGGGIQMMEPASVQAHPKYIPDRILRSTGPASEMDPWPKELHADLPDGGSKK